jgi:hypothetical protein
MFHPHAVELDLTAAEARSHLAQLHAERALAASNGMEEIPAYIADLDEEIEIWRRVVGVIAVTEIATLRAELFGADRG